MTLTYYVSAIRLNFRTLYRACRISPAASFNRDTIIAKVPSVEEFMILSVARKKVEHFLATNGLLDPTLLGAIKSADFAQKT